MTPLPPPPDEVPSYERAKKEFEEEGLGVRMHDRVKVNTSHVKAHRRLILVEEMLKIIVPGLTD